tara:strand:+ start:8320 stop:9366 length:1047 start_codon:yes stop_codon:yes gene_type:complete
MIFHQDLIVPIFFSIFISFVLFYFFKINNFLVDQVNSSNHKQLTAQKSPTKSILCGGIIIFLGCVLFFDVELYIIKILSGSILFVGILSDINKLNSPKFRIISQFFIVLLLLLFNKNLAIVDLRINFINDILQIKFFSISFTIFCILILINGSNFLDGINTLVIGYYLIVLSVIIALSNEFNLYLNPNIFYLIIFLSIVFLFNFFNKIYLGDAGSYLISFLSAFFLLDFISKNDLISPYFICLLLWYPAFENFFSIIRRVFSKKKLDKPDQKHLHQMIYSFLSYNKLLNKRHTNTATGIIINLFNVIILFFSYKYYLVTESLVIVILFNISIYLLLYFFIKKQLNHFN